MRNFDEERRPVARPEDRSFIIAGQQFTVRERVRPEVLSRVDDLSTDKSGTENIRTSDQIIIDCLLPEDAARWHEARADETNIIEIDDMQRIANWALEVLTDRPLDESEPSLGISENTEPTSPGISSLLQGAPSPPSMHAVSST